MRVLNMGDRGNDVIYLQSLLNKEGSELDLDGVFGALTETAVESFQLKTGLDIDGVVGRFTWESLQGKHPKESKDLDTNKWGKIDYDKFFEKYQYYFGENVSRETMKGYTAMLEYWNKAVKEEELHPNWLPYCLASAYHETGWKSRLIPCREGWKKTDESAVAHVKWLYANGYTSAVDSRGNPYYVEAENGKVFFGRGLIQLTWERNYRFMGQRQGVGTLFYDDPDQLLTLKYSVPTLYIGMIEGLFTGRRLGQYINAKKTDYYNARRIVNGTDKANDIQGYALDFEKCLMQ